MRLRILARDQQRGEPYLIVEVDPFAGGPRMAQ